MNDELSLDQYGFHDCKIPLSLRSIEKQLPTWKSLRCLRPPEMHGSRMLQLSFDPIPAADDGKEPYYVAIQLMSKLDEGTYGTIYKALRAAYYPVKHSDDKHVLERSEDFYEIISKITPITLSSKELALPKEEQERCYAEEIQAILHEASLHILVFHTMQRYGYRTAIPHIYDVFARTSTSVRERVPTAASHVRSVAIQMEFVEGQTLHSFLHTHFPSSHKQSVRSANSMLLIDILIQLCVYLDILQSNLYFNHRDLKTNNVLLRKQGDTWSRPIQHRVLRTKWMASHDVVLIDFGFSCLAYGVDSPKSIVQAGCWFKPTHDCLKPGRDLALFLYCLQSCFPLEGRISGSLWHVLKQAMETVGENPVSLLEVGVDEDGQLTDREYEFGEGIYKFLRRSGVDIPGCAPATLLQSLDAYLHGGS